MRWCARCGVEIDDGLLLCAACVPRNSLRQSVNIDLDTPPNVEIDKASGSLVGHTRHAGHTVVKARDGGGKSRLRAVEKVEWIHDRQRYERRVCLFDRDNNLYSETCFDEEKGQITWGPKSGPLTDQSIHGPQP